jgi:hypothetical protein
MDKVFLLIPLFYSVGAHQFISSVSAQLNLTTSNDFGAFSVTSIDLEECPFCRDNFEENLYPCRSNNTGGHRIVVGMEWTRAVNGTVPLLLSPQDVTAEYPWFQFASTVTLSHILEANGTMRTVITATTACVSMENEAGMVDCWRFHQYNTSSGVMTSSNYDLVFHLHSCPPPLPTCWEPACFTHCAPTTLDVNIGLKLTIYQCPMAPFILENSVQGTLQGYLHGERHYPPFQLSMMQFFTLALVLDHPDLSVNIENVLICSVLPNASLAQQACMLGGNCSEYAGVRPGCNQAQWLDLGMHVLDEEYPLVLSRTSYNPIVHTDVCKQQECDICSWDLGDLQNQSHFDAVTFPLTHLKGDWIMDVMGSVWDCQGHPMSLHAQKNARGVTSFTVVPLEEPHYHPLGTKERPRALQVLCLNGVLFLLSIKNGRIGG